MTTAIAAFGSAILLYLILRPIVNWYQKAKKEMEEDDKRDRTE